MFFSPNYIAYSPYQIKPFGAKVPLAAGSHWFLIQLLATLSNISTYGNSEGIYFSNENMVSNGWFKLFLSHEQFLFLNKSSHFQLYPIDSKNKVKKTIKTVKSKEFYVHASKNWVPPDGSRLISRISDTIYHVDNFTITAEVKDDNRILSIKSAALRRPLNRYTSGFLQNGHQKSVYADRIFAPIRSVHKIGLDGNGQTVNVVDSGIDVFNAFFYDPNNSLDSITAKTNLNHRKVVRIEPYADNTDDERGHGTHVSGTIVGNAYCTENLCGISQYNGIAPSAKVYFSDIGDSETGEMSGKFDLNDQLNLFKQLDVHVSSNSWGFNFNVPEEEFAYNKIAYENPDVLYVFAAGNSQNYNTINCPGNAKNVLSIGATESISSSILEFSFTTIEVQNSSFSFEAQEFMARIISNKMKDDPLKYYVDLSVVDYDNIDQSNFKDKVVILNRDNLANDTEICTRLLDVEENGAAAAFYIPNVNYFTCSDVTPNIPLLRISKSNLVDLSNMGKISLLPFSGSETSLPKVSYTSSKGPADSGLLKPELVLPGGNIFSASSHGSNTQNVVVNSSFLDNVARNSGTSMATPAASALALIIRQFLQEGYYPGLKKQSGNKISPSSCLLKSILINTAEKPESFMESDQKSEPRNDAGFGIPCLERALGFNGVGFRFVDNEIMPSKSHFIYKVELNSNSADLNITMSYLDPPLNPDNENLFFADLDIFVKSPNGKFYNGNGASESESFSLTERIIIDKNEIPSNGGVFEIHIISSEYPIIDQKVIYSIVVNGPFEQNAYDKNPVFLTRKNASSNNECVNNCGNNGQCNQGICVCNEGFIGPSCNSVVTEVIDSDFYESTYNQKQIKYYKLKVENSTFNTFDFDIDKSPQFAPAYFCVNFEENPGKIANSGWECHSACKAIEQDSDIDGDFDNDYLYYCNYTFRFPSKKKVDSVFMAVYTGYYQPTNIGIENISFYHVDYGDEVEIEESKDKTIFIAGIVILIILLVSSIAMIVGIALQNSVNKKKLNEKKENLNNNELL